jgi:hypothetical protein
VLTAPVVEADAALEPAFPLLLNGTLDALQGGGGQDLARLGRRPAVHQGLLATFAVFRGSLFVVYATRWGF